MAEKQDSGCFPWILICRAWQSWHRISLSATNMSEHIGSIISHRTSGRIISTEAKKDENNFFFHTPFKPDSFTGYSKCDIYFHRNQKKGLFVMVGSTRYINLSLTLEYATYYKPMATWQLKIMCQVAVITWGLSLILCQPCILEGLLKCFLLPVQELA